MSSNVACSISNVSIGYGSKARYILLVPKKVNDMKEMLINPMNRMFQINDVFNPVALPVKGIYKGYGEIQDIEKTASVKHLEDHFGLDISEIIKITASSRTIFETIGPLYEHFVIQKETLRAYNKELKDVLVELGFSMISENTYMHPKSNVFAFKINADETLSILKNEDGEDKEVRTIRGGNIINGVAKFIHEKTGYYILVSDEDQEKVSQLSLMSGMFVHEDVYQLLSNKENLELRHSLHPENGRFERYYDKVLKAIDDYEKSEKKLDPNWDPKNPMGDLGSDLFELFRECSDIQLFKPLYLKDLQNKELQTELTEFFYFKEGMNSTNRFFFPSMNGEESGNFAATKALAELTIKISDQEIEKRKLELEEDED